MKKIIDILAIVLPAFIIIASIARIFMKKTKGMNGLTIFLAILLLLGGTIRYLFYSKSGSENSDPPKLSLPVIQHSDAFNQSLENILNAYYKMTEGFVNWDTSVINNSGNELRNALEGLDLEQLKKDTTGIYETALEPLVQSKTEVASIVADPSLSEKRGSLNILSDNLRLLLTAVRYDRAVLYWQECPMAFGADHPGNWLSKTEEVRNPYLGTKDPQYGNKMLHCGAPKYTIKFDSPSDGSPNKK
ncbi:MAG: DUF3347 domain-containing protein [Chitinophagaceae bacterium]